MIDPRAEHEIVSQLNKTFGNQLVSVVLFGSHAKGKARKYSDIDILAIVKQLPDNWGLQDELAGRISRELYKKEFLNTETILMTPDQVDSAIESNSSFV